MSMTALAFVFGLLFLPSAVSAAAPSANAGSDQSIILPAHGVTLSGQGTDSDGTIVRYQWTEISSGGATFAASGSAVTAVTDLAYGTYTFRLTVTDNDGGTASDDVYVAVNPSPNTFPTKKIVVLGSSTAAGAGATSGSASWVGKYTTYLQQLNPGNTVVNLAVGGTTTYHILPTGSTTPSRPSADSVHNITAAIAQDPDAIIVNMPSNDAAFGYSALEQQTNFQIIATASQAAGIAIWIATPQPRSLNDAGVLVQTTVRDWVLSTYGSHALDFWTNIATPAGLPNPVFGYGDGVHLNNLGHQKLYNRVVGSGLWEELFPPIISHISASRTTDTSAVITWETNEAGTSQVSYGPSNSYGIDSTDASLVTSHSIALSGLSPSTQYHFKVTSADAVGNAASSSDQLFTTGNPPSTSSGGGGSRGGGSSHITRPAPSTPSPVPTSSPAVPQKTQSSLQVRTCLRVKRLASNSVRQRVNARLMARFGFGCG